MHSSGKKGKKRGNGKQASHQGLMFKPLLCANYNISFLGQIHSSLGDISESLEAVCIFIEISWKWNFWYSFKNTSAFFYFSANCDQKLVRSQFSFPQCKQSRHVCPASYQRRTVLSDGPSRRWVCEAAAPDSKLGFVQFPSCLTSFCYFLSSHCFLPPPAPAPSFL